eukprot:scaffold145740_cov19-Tisochrysis_lutea.AAC.1
MRAHATEEASMCHHPHPSGDQMCGAPQPRSDSSAAAAGMHGAVGVGAGVGKSEQQEEARGSGSGSERQREQASEAAAKKAGEAAAAGAGVEDQPGEAGTKGAVGVRYESDEDHARAVRAARQALLEAQRRLAPGERSVCEARWRWTVQAPEALHSPLRHCAVHGSEGSSVRQVSALRTDMKPGARNENARLQEARGPSGKIGPLTEGIAIMWLCGWVKLELLLCAWRL